MIAFAIIKNLPAGSEAGLSGNPFEFPNNRVSVIRGMTSLETFMTTDHA